MICPSEPSPRGFPGACSVHWQTWPEPAHQQSQARLSGPVPPCTSVPPLHPTAPTFTGTTGGAELIVVMNLFNSLRPRQHGRHFADDTFKCIFLNESVWIPITISLEFVPKGPINNIPALVHMMAWRRPGNKPLSESMMVRLPMHIYVTRPQWVKETYNYIFSFYQFSTLLIMGSLCSLYNVSNLLCGLARPMVSFI